MTDPREGWKSGLTNDEIRQQALRGYLANRDWTHGLTRERILADLALTPVLAEVVERGLAPGVYYSAADVLAALPASAWAPPATVGAGEQPERQGDRRGTPGGLPGVPPQVLAGAGGAAVLGALVLLWERRRQRQRGGPRWRWLQA